jgi:hypothetical protein
MLKGFVTPMVQIPFKNDGKIIENSETAGRILVIESWQKSNFRVSHAKKLIFLLLYRFCLYNTKVIGP